jgi:CxxC motif-containing protein (DUF1111 family)
VGCALCHTPNLAGVGLFSDLLLHSMGTELADGSQQGSAGSAQFRTAPLWGLGQRLFFLHDGRAENLLEAISAHKSAGSEANVIELFDGLDAATKQDLLNFLLIEALQAHKSPGNGQFGPSKGNTVIDNFNKLSKRDKQVLFNFLRSL